MKASKRQKEEIVGQIVKVNVSFQDENCQARILESRKVKKQFEYYVTFLNHDSRLDRWISESDIIEWPESSNIATSPKKRTRHSTIATNVAPTPQNTTPPAVKGAIADKNSAQNEHDEPVVKLLQYVQLGPYKMTAWYPSPYPPPYHAMHTIFVDEFSLMWFKDMESMLHHTESLDLEQRMPPGQEIYRGPCPWLNPPKGTSGSQRRNQTRKAKNSSISSKKDKQCRDPQQYLSVFHIHGGLSKRWCQRLCLLSKLFLKHKTLEYDTEGFTFFVLTKKDVQGYHIIGYFSRELSMPNQHHVSCIVTLPCYQGAGYGRLLIQISYELAKCEGLQGAPERPLSDLGLVSFRSYQLSVILPLLQSFTKISLHDIGVITGIREDDVAAVLTSIGALKYAKGRHIISLDEHIANDMLPKLLQKNKQMLDTSKLDWPLQGYAHANVSTQQNVKQAQ